MATYIPILSTAAIFSSTPVTTGTYGARHKLAQDTEIGALYFSLVSKTMTAKAAVYDVDTGALLGEGPTQSVPTASSASVLRLPLNNSVKLAANKEYMFCIQVVSGNANISISNRLGTYGSADYSFTTTLDIVYKGTGAIYPTGTQTSSYTVISGFDVFIPTVPIFELVAGFIEDTSSPLNITYRVENPDNNALSMIISLDGSTILTDNNPGHNIQKNLNLTSQWPSLPYGSNKLAVTFTTLAGTTVTQEFFFVKLLPASLPLIESTAAINDALNTIKNKRDSISDFIGLPETASFDEILESMEMGAVAKVASGNLQVNGATSVTVTGLAFKPKVVVIAYTGIYGQYAAQGVIVLTEDLRFYRNLNSTTPPKVSNMIYGLWNGNTGGESGHKGVPVDLLRADGFIFTNADLYGNTASTYNFNIIDWQAFG